MAWRRLWLGAVLLLAGCAVADFDTPGGQPAPRLDEAAYTAMFPYYAEFCAVSQISKKPGYGADIRGEIGGHAVFYLNGACREEDANYPVLRLCDGGGSAGDGVGISMNAHFSNAKWVATPGRDFFFDGGLAPGAGLTRDGYRDALATAKRLGIYRGVRFHQEFLAARPAEIAAADYEYEISIATDFAIALGRGRYCARVPLDRTRMARIVAFMNEQNAPYRDGAEVFRWSVFQDNCIHLAHNALAAAGLWPEWPTHRPLLLAMLDFPVPRNEFVNLMRRTGDIALLDPETLYGDPARRSLTLFGALPVGPGALATVAPPLRPNAVYDTGLKLIFYDEPVLARYQSRFDAIFADPGRTDLTANLATYRELYRRAATQRADESGLSREETGFRELFRAALARDTDRLDRAQAGPRF